VCIEEWNVRGGRLYVKGELQIAVPLDFYYRHLARFGRNHGRLYWGVDVNTGRINLAIVDAGGRFRYTYTFWFEESSRKGYPKHRARDIIETRIHEMLRYAYHHGVKILSPKNPDILGRLRLLWIRGGERMNENHNWRAAVFRSSVIEMITLKAPLY